MTDPITLQEWQAEMERRGKLDCKFVCPACGNVASPNDWTAAGGDYQCAPVQCIGRLNPKVMAGGKFEPGPLGGCDWVAWGLLDICPVHLILPGNAKPSPVFGFAP